ncbi:MAG TPA: homocysteine S-methyltransferase family protein [Thermodesulfobacteriota bacterium]|nr:homocysteine S-methyltransferase family protein [Thermodesulfobacteriota bacterium]
MHHFLFHELQHRMLIGSGAIGTSLRAQAAEGEPVELLNLRQPDTVRALHAAYREAGSQILVTNTFAANSVTLGEAGFAALGAEINRTGVRLAREAARDDCLVWASIGPLGLGLRLADFPADDLLRIYREQCASLVEADALLLETFTDPREAQAALHAAKETGIPIIFQIGQVGGGRRRWDRVDTLLAEALREGITAVGANCLHPHDIVAMTAHLAGRTDLPITASPNAGHPVIERGKVTYEYAPEDLAAVGQELASLGAAVIGGCCGTTPEHIRRLAEALRGRHIAPRSTRLASGAAQKSATPSRKSAANPIRSLMKSSDFVLSVEIRADRMQSLEEIVAGAATISAAGADLFDVPDNPGATVGRDAMVTAARLQDLLQVPSIPHLSVTNSNVLRLHSTLLGAWDLGLRGMLAVTGDVPSMGHLGSLAGRVADLKSSVELLRLVRKLHGGQIINGEEVADPPDFCAGCAVGRATAAHIKWLRSKVEAGAEFVFSQPVFDYESFERLRDAVAPLGIRFFPGLLPLTSRRNAEALAGGRIPGVVVPTGILDAFSRYESRKDQHRFGLEMATTLAIRIACQAQGLYLIMPFGKRRYEETASLVREVKQSLPHP